MLQDPNRFKSALDKPEKLAYRIEDAVYTSGLSRSTLYKLIEDGKLASIKAAGRRLILAADLKSFLEAQREAA